MTVLIKILDGDTGLKAREEINKCFTKADQNEQGVAAAVGGTLVNEQAITDLANEVGQLSNDVVVLDQNVTNLGIQVGDLDQDVTNLGVEVVALDQAVTDLGLVSDNHELRIVELEANQRFDPTYDFAKSVNIIAGEIYTELLNYTTDAPLNGILYEFGLSLSWQYTVANKSAYLRFSTDGGVSWTEFIGQPKDQTDVVPFVYIFPIAFTGSPNVIIELRKQDASGILTAFYSDSWIKRVK
jgi:hypothetical protein